MLQKLTGWQYNKEVNCWDCPDLKIRAVICNGGCPVVLTNINEVKYLHDNFNVDVMAECPHQPSLFNPDKVKCDLPQHNSKE